MRTRQNIFLQLKILLSWKCTKPKWCRLYQAKKRGQCIFYHHRSLFLHSNPVHYLCLLSSLFVCITPTDINGRPAHVRREDNQILNVFFVWQLNPQVQEILHFMSTYVPTSHFKKMVFIYLLLLLYKQISYIHLIIGCILQKYIKTGAEHSRSFIEKSLCHNPNPLPEIYNLSEEKEKKYFSEDIYRTKVTE